MRLFSLFLNDKSDRRNASNKNNILFDSASKRPTQKGKPSLIKQGPDWTHSTLEIIYYLPLNYTKYASHPPRLRGL